MSIDRDFIKRYGPPKYKLNHRLMFHNDELYIVRPKPDLDLELLNDRLGRHTFSRTGKLYPREGMWAVPSRFKIVNRHPAYRYVIILVLDLIIYKIFNILI